MTDADYPRIFWSLREVEARNTALFAAWMREQTETKEQD